VTRKASGGRGPLVTLKGIRKTYWLGSTPVRALRNVTLGIREGDFVSIMGPSGSGKSTLMHILGLLDVPDEGSYRLAGRETAELSEDELASFRGASIGFVFQQFNLLPRMSAAENIALPTLYGTRTGPARAGAAERAALARMLSLADRLAHTPAELSGGQQQRVAIARSLVNHPKLILADEPTGNLDSVTQREIMSLLARLNRAGLTVILVTHEPDVARWTRRVIWMRDGRIVADRKQRGIPAPARRGLLALAAPAGRKAGSPSVIAAPQNPAPAAPGWKGLCARAIDCATAFVPASRVLLTMSRSHLSEAGRALGANKVRSSLSTLGILIGVAAVIAMVALGTGAKRSMTDTISKMGSSVISVSPNWWRAHGHGGGRGREFSITRLTVEDAVALRRAHHAIRRTAPVYWRSVALTANGKDWNCSCIGSSPDYAEVRAQHPAVGRFYTADEVQDRARVCLLGRTPYRELFGEGVNPVGQSVRVNKIPFTVIGILPEKGMLGRWDPDDNILVPLGTAMYRLGGDRYISSIDIQVDPEADVEEICDRVRRFLVNRYRLKGDREESFDVRNEIAMRQAWVQVSQTMALLLGIIAGISLLVGGIGIMNIMLVSVTERTREIGLRKAVGARQRDILFQFLLEAVTISVLGGTLGILLGTGISFLLAYLLEWTIIVTAWSVFLAFGFSAAVGVGFGFWPARRAAALHPAEALRYE